MKAPAQSFDREQGCVLFDLDGTLIDTAPDIVAAANALFTAHQRPPLTIETLRPIAGEGTVTFIEKGMGYRPEKEEFLALRTELFEYYRKQQHRLSCLFPQVETILNWLNIEQIPWGIVTNKLTEFTLPLMAQFPILKTHKTLVCFDTLSKAKPHPEPIWHACETLKRLPSHSVYIGDHERDVQAGKAAGLFVILAMYGYIRCEQEALSWPADLFLYKPRDLLTFFTRLNRIC